MSEHQGAKSNPWQAMVAAVQFLTRLPVPEIVYTERTLPAALAYFPLVGLGLGALAGEVNRLLVPHLARGLAAVAAVLLLVLMTGGLHEDGLADCADAFGSWHPVARTLEILRDSRIGSYGAIALALSLLARVLLVAALPFGRVLPVMIAAHVLCRWSALPLALLPAARADVGLGVQVAGRAPVSSLVIGTALALGITGFALHWSAILAVVCACAVTGLTAWFYQRRIGGVTGDCFGATNQLVELAVLTCGAWVK